MKVEYDAENYVLKSIHLQNSLGIHVFTFLISRDETSFSERFHVDITLHTTQNLSLQL